MAYDSMTMDERRAAVANLLEWMRSNLPDAYLGIVQRFTPGGGLGDVSTTIKTAASTVVNGVTNFVSSAGFQSLVDKALPFLANKQQQQALAQQARLAQSGYTTINAATGTPAVVPISTVTAPPVGSSLTGSVNWAALAPWAAGAGVLFLLLSRRR